MWEIYAKQSSGRIVRIDRYKSEHERENTQYCTVLGSGILTWFFSSLSPEVVNQGGPLLTWPEALKNLWQVRMWCACVNQLKVFINLNVWRTLGKYYIWKFDLSVIINNNFSFSPFSHSWNGAHSVNKFSKTILRATQSPHNGVFSHRMGVFRRRWMYGAH